MSDIQPGDVVVCVDDGPCGCGCGDGSGLRLNKYYRVLRYYPVGTDGDPFAAVGLVGVDHRSPYHPKSNGIGIHRFRKIRPADDQFTRQMRSIKPRQKAREDA